MHEENALRLCEAIKKLANSEDALNNFCSYLTYHFPRWMERFCTDADGLVNEFETFADMYD